MHPPEKPSLLYSGVLDLKQKLSGPLQHDQPSLKYSCVLDLKENAARNAAARSAESEQQTVNRRVEDAMRHAVAREAECPQQTAARLAASAARFAATISNETQDEANDRRQSNASIQRRSRETRQTSKVEYLDVFYASVNGPLHAQPFVDKHMKTFHSELHQLNQQHCLHCRELWPTRDAIVDPYICCRCKKLTEFNPFGIQNDMKHIRELTPIEEMLLSPVISIMSVFRLPTGGHVSRGYVANFKQDVAGFIREIPLTAAQLPCLVIRRRGVDNTCAEFKVCRKRVEAVGRFLIQNHPGFASHRITFSQTSCDLLPEDGLLLNIPTMDSDNDDLNVTDEGAMTRDVSPEEILDQPQPLDVAFVISNNIRPPQQNEILNALDPVNWPTISTEPINEFEVMSGLASLAFIKLFPRKVADKTYPNSLLLIT
ncbi:hypothetical protein DAPPUDRAFT_267695 [Daphnia pulex]|uniref:DUF6570 domain-containing protein n=1 Tax=Daphnia pulex TaxID=6669 RepID=E9HWV0_DAPPU|nr:hypothetical protein DAPPUDRAFT_267695 [Daphnia pulex]|eukprot:EFX63780.1 hypothetical protein DAPPUDRAFT_267695 [Daphnia pulex]